MDPKVKVPDQVKAGEVFAIKTLINHPMHSGLLKDADGKLIPRLILKRFECRFGDQLLFACNLEPAMAENPFIEFAAKLATGGTLLCIWFEDGGASVTERVKVDVVG